MNSILEKIRKASERLQAHHGQILKPEEYPFTVQGARSGTHRTRKRNPKYLEAPSPSAGRLGYLRDVMARINLAAEEPYERLSLIAKELGVRYKTLLGWSRRQGFPVLRLPEGSLRARRSEVAAWLEQFQTREVSHE
jgi:hypothetical protein